ncbi:transcription factor HAC1 Ecym_1506 [Eremothecium cymbalariae DBVPG|uniref:BZIP domain-containing protein n=1 Tax=Eremothecium cymbalariae (strain CBS 270.75 / DBVPG 7215 / KCTC 17166 / NRRL Y-17582) TaxID=931890 RepID=G8JMR5_ERECY|nr:hypothetical protein Ecym_1506 [Eremothecium cymbalariae DBVPG\
MSHTVNDIPANFKSTLPPRKRAKTQEEKEQRRIERILRNRKAAHQSREKKRLHLMYLERKCSLLERIMSHVNLGQLVESTGDPELRRAVTEYEAVVKADPSTSPEANASFSGSVEDNDNLERYEKDANIESSSASTSALSSATTPIVKSPSISGTTPGSPCTTIVGGENSRFERRDFIIENANDAVKPESTSTDSYSYVGGANYHHPSFSVFEDSDPRVFSGSKANNESWNLLLTQSHNYPLGGSNIFKDDISEPFELTDSSLDLDHWRNPAEIVQWKE